LLVSIISTPTIWCKICTFCSFFFWWHIFFLLVFQTIFIDKVMFLCIWLYRTLYIKLEKIVKYLFFGARKVTCCYVLNILYWEGIFFGADELNKNWSSLWKLSNWFFQRRLVVSTKGSLNLYKSIFKRGFFNAAILTSNGIFSGDQRLFLIAPVRAPFQGRETTFIVITITKTMCSLSLFIIFTFIMYHEKCCF